MFPPVHIQCWSNVILNLSLSDEIVTVSNATGGGGGNPLDCDWDNTSSQTDIFEEGYQLIKMAKWVESGW